MDWDLSPYFDAFNGPAYLAMRDGLKNELPAIRKQADQLRTQSGKPDLAAWEAILFAYENAMARQSHLTSYISCLSASDARNADYLREEAALAPLQAAMSKLVDALVRGIGELDDAAFAALCQRPGLGDIAFVLAEWRQQASQRMEAELESLAADLGVDGIAAWSRLYFTNAGNLKFRYLDPHKGEVEVPLSQYNALLSEPDRNRRLAVKAGADACFAEHQHTCAAALNAIAGSRLALNQRRGLKHFLEPSLRQMRIQHETLDALMAAITARQDFARSIFSFRSTHLGIHNPGYADLRAPLTDEAAAAPDWQTGISLVSRAFNTAYPSLGTFFDEMVARRWIDYSPRAGKRPGGFCTTSLRMRESRIFMTYKNTLSDVLTLAHEAGHAWHAHLLGKTRALACGYPMTLAEAASTYAERILTDGVLANPQFDDQTRLMLLDADVTHMIAFLLDLPVRFHFEKEVYRRRHDTTLSPAELCELMAETQRKVFGNSLAPGGEDTWFWASKLHFFIDDVEFYNYPYTFGYLLSTAYVERLRAGESDAVPAFETFLENSGRMDCESVVRETLGEDIRRPEFWTAQIDALAGTFAKYRQLLGERASRMRQQLPADV